MYSEANNLRHQTDFGFRVSSQIIFDLVLNFISNYIASSVPVFKEINHYDIITGEFIWEVNITFNRLYQ